MSFQAKNSDNSSDYESPNVVTYNTSGYFRAEKGAPLQATSSNVKPGSKRKSIIPSYGGAPFPAPAATKTSYASVADSY